VASFAHWLRVMDVDESDLQQLFTMVDEDGSGEIDPGEFTQAMFRMKNTEPRTATRFVKHLVAKLHERHDKVSKTLEKLQRLVENVALRGEDSRARMAADMSAAESLGAHGEGGARACMAPTRSSYWTQSQLTEPWTIEEPKQPAQSGQPRLPEAEEAAVKATQESLDAAAGLIARPAQECLLESLRMQEQSILDAVEGAIRQAAAQTLMALGAAGPQAMAQSIPEGVLAKPSPECTDSKT